MFKRFLYYVWLKGIVLVLVICFFFYEGFCCILWFRRVIYICVFFVLLLDYFEDSFWLVFENMFLSFDFLLNKNFICMCNNVWVILFECIWCYVWRYYCFFLRVIFKLLVISVIRYYFIIWVLFFLNWWMLK